MELIIKFYTYYDCKDKSKLYKTKNPVSNKAGFRQLFYH
ncbi:hypothetical protein SAMN04515674_101464 [Pseudarcicella hirudinis]|uniref:Uncharacterized protein n=1 Tax=Pseudarcicella hirudinis TaxID=1079859 RepID=A0A1I5MVA9_9BACT|nr:hypothetical protein SAMN04515674_101464 [Pseudarcicella hirudinis]